MELLESYGINSITFFPSRIRRTVYLCIKQESTITVMVLNQQARIKIFPSQFVRNI
jgi:hypothetical protein